MNIRLLLSELVRIGLEAIEPHLPRPRVIYDRVGLSPYLSRYYLFGGPRSTDGRLFDDHGSPLPGIKWQDLPVNLYLHKFHRGDDDTALHSHPWKWSVSFILAGGYVEERRYERPYIGPRWGVMQRMVLPFSFNFIGGDDFHRVDLIDDRGAWSLFLAGPKASSWYFWDRETRKTTPWREFIFNLRHGAPAEA